MFEQNLPSVTLTGVVNPQSDQTRKPLRSTVKQAVSHYLAELDGEDVTELYETVLAEVEAPLLDVVMQYTRGNQTRASTLLGINRGTLRKKLKKYGMN